MTRIIIYGAGAIGCTVGGHLARAGTAVVLIGRAGHVAAIRKDGLRFITPSGTHTLRLLAVTGPHEITFQADDVVFLCMKGQNTEQALRDLKAVADDIPLFCFQNGVRNEEIASRYYRRVYGVMVHIGGTYLKDGEVIGHRDPPGEVVIGCYPTGLDDLAVSIADMLRCAGFRVMTTDDIMPYKWGKLMSNLANAIGAITDGQDPAGRIAKAVRAEASVLLEKAGIRWVSQQQLEQEWPQFREPIRGEVARQGHSSTWQSLMRGQGSVETAFLNGEIVRLAHRLGTEAPLNAALQRVAEEMAAKGEKPGKYSPAQLAAILGLPEG